MTALLMTPGLDFEWDAADAEHLANTANRAEFVSWQRKRGYLLAPGQLWERVAEGRRR